MTDTVTPRAVVSQALTTLRWMRDPQGGGTARIEGPTRQGQDDARERLSVLLDEGSFGHRRLGHPGLTDFGMGKRFTGDGVITGFGKINGRRVAVYAQDFTVLGGSFSQVQAQKINKIQDLALESGIPIVGLNDSGGARVQEGVRSLAAYGEVFQRNVAASGVIPQISLIMGPCAGGAVYSPALTDFTIMVDQTSNMFLTGPEIVASVTGEQVTAEELGGAAVHAGRSGVAQFEAKSEVQALELTKLLLSYLPANTSEDAPSLLSDDSPDRMSESLNDIVPDDERNDMRNVLDEIFVPTRSSVHQSFAPTRSAPSPASTAGRWASWRTSRW